MTKILITICMIIFSVPMYCMEVERLAVIPIIGQTISVSDTENICDLLVSKILETQEFTAIVYKYCLPGNEVISNELKASNLNHAAETIGKEIDANIIIFVRANRKKTNI